MGAVYRAVDTRLERRVALKVLRRDPSPSPEARASAAARVLREARAVALIDHPNAVAVYDVGEAGEAPYIAMELVNGRSLRSYVGASAPGYGVGSALAPSADNAEASTVALGVSASDPTASVSM